VQRATEPIIIKKSVVDIFLIESYNCSFFLLLAVDTSEDKDG
jgi:hypothetical protein